MKKITLIICGLALASCSAPQPRKPYSLQEGGLVIFATDQDQKMLFTKDVGKSDTHRFCLTPQHDSAATYNSGMSISGATPIAKEGLTAGSGKGELALGGRSPSVLIARELMYRACEVTANHNADMKTTLDVYERFLQAIEKMTVTQTEAGSAPYSLADRPMNMDMMDSAEKARHEDDDEDDDDDDEDEDKDDGKEKPQKEDDNL